MMSCHALTMENSASFVKISMRRLGSYGVRALMDEDTDCRSLESRSSDWDFSAGISMTY